MRRPGVYDRQCVRAALLASMARCSSGGTASASTWASASQAPVALATSIARRPAGVISPAAIIFAARARFGADQTLFALRGVNICM